MQSSGYQHDHIHCGQCISGSWQSKRLVSSRETVCLFVLMFPVLVCFARETSPCFDHFIYATHPHLLLYELSLSFADDDDKMETGSLIMNFHDCEKEMEICLVSVNSDGANTLIFQNINKKSNRLTY